MNDQATQIRELTVELPESAPLIRVTAGMGSTGQKTWNLRRPVTVIGSRRPAHIVLHDASMSNAHCVIVNTGTEVLLKDLHTNSGTQLNQTRVNLAVLADGDVITVGGTTIQVAIQIPDGGSDDSSCGMKFADPTKFPGPVSLQLLHTEKHWTVADAVALIGRHDDATVRLDHTDMSSRHAILFRVGNRPAIFDLGSRTGLWVNGRRCSIAPLQDDDRITVGSFGLSLQCLEPSVSIHLDEPVVRPIAEFLTPPPTHGVHDIAPQASVPESPAAAPINLAEQVDRPYAETESNLENLQSNLSEAVKLLNVQREQLRDGASAIEELKTTAHARETDAQEAVLRGQLHEITRFHEQVLTRERELAANIAQLQAGADSLAEARKACEQREADLDQREEEMSRRERAIAQRWSRLSAVTCPHCRKPLNVAKGSFDAS